MSKADRSRKTYPSDLTDEPWTIVAPLSPPAKSGPRGGHPRQVDMRAVLNTLFSLHRSGCQWDMLPHDLLPKSRVYDYFAQWRDNGTWAKIVQALRECTRVAAGREPTPSAACFELLGVEVLDIQQMLLEGGFDVLRQHGDTVFLALAVAHNALMIGNIQVFHSQTQALQQAQPGTIQERGHDPWRAREMAQHRRHLVPGQDHGQPLRLLGVHHVVQPADVVLEDLLIKHMFPPRHL
jgi:transposase